VRIWSGCTRRGKNSKRFGKGKFAKSNKKQSFTFVHRLYRPKEYPKTKTKRGGESVAPRLKILVASSLSNGSEQKEQKAFDGGFGVFFLWGGENHLLRKEERFGCILPLVLGSKRCEVDRFGTRLRVRRPRLSESCEGDERMGGP